MVANVMPITQDAPVPKAASRLCNFNTGRYELLQDHKDWIDKTLGPKFSQLNGVWIDLIGYASKLGDSTFNQQLSTNRIDAVRQYISTWRKNINFQKETALGEEQSYGDEANNDGYFRAVEVYLYGSPPPPLRPRIEKKRPPKKTFAIRMVSSISVSLGIPGIDAVAFDIGEPTIRKWRRFWYIGGSMNIAISIPKIPDLPGSVGGSGASVKFTTSRPCEIEDFEGEATLINGPGAAVGSASVGGDVGLSIESKKLVPKGAVINPKVIVMNNDSGIQLGAGGAGKGYLYMRQ